MTIHHYWNSQQVERFLDSLADLGLRRARVAALIMWRSGLRVGETVALEWRDIDVMVGSRFRLFLWYWEWISKLPMLGCSKIAYEMRQNRNDWRNQKFTEITPEMMGL